MPFIVWLQFYEVLIHRYYGSFDHVHKLSVSLWTTAVCNRKLVSLAVFSASNSLDYFELICICKTVDNVDG